MKMTLKNSDNDVKISFKIVEKGDEEIDNIQIRFFFSQNVLNPNSKIRIS